MAPLAWNGDTVNMRLFRNYVGLGFLMTILFNVVLLVISIPFGFEDSMTGPTLQASILHALVMGVLVGYVVLKLGPTSKTESFRYSFVWALITLALTLVVTVANDTTRIFFSQWYSAIVFVAMAIAPGFLRTGIRGGDPIDIGGS